MQEKENGAGAGPPSFGRGSARIAGLALAALVTAGCGLFQSAPAEEPAPPPAEAPAPPVEPEEAERPEPTPEPTPRPEREPEPEPEPEEPAPERAERARPAPVPILPGAVLPRERIVAFYGNANSTRMGILGELPPEEMLARLDEEVRRWERADPSTPVRPALHLITTMATGDPGADGKYRLRMPSAVIERVLGWADTRDALVFLDIQPGQGSVAEELPRLEKWLTRPDVHLALDPEWAMPEGAIPGRQIGSMRAADVNVAVEFLADLVEEHGLPPKVLVVHRFTSHMLPNPEDIHADPRVQLVLNMDGWGPPAQKIHTYRQIVAPDVFQWAGFKLFFKNDRRGGSRLLTPEEILALDPVPFYIQYQ